MDSSKKASLEINTEKTMHVMSGFHNVQTCYGAYPALYPVSTGDCFLRGKVGGA
jgi:hypothetical protein